MPRTSASSSLPQQLRSLQERPICQDMFTTTFLDDNDVNRNCTWLAEKLSADFDRANRQYCGRVGGMVLTDYRTPLAAVLCPVTCGRDCSYTPATCKDTSAIVGKPSLVKKKKKCKWIKKSQKRLKRYCSEEDGVRSRGDAACPKTCGKCGQSTVLLETPAPTATPSLRPSDVPSKIVSNVPSASPTDSSSSYPSSYPTNMPSDRESPSPSNELTSTPSGQPTVKQSPSPSNEPTSMPSDQPTVKQSSSPSTAASEHPTVIESSNPSAMPSYQPSLRRSQSPSSVPSAMPSVTASSPPSLAPSAPPTKQPTEQPTKQPTEQPTEQPTPKPTRLPTAPPTYNLAERAAERLEQCGDEKIASYDFQNVPPIEAQCDVCVSTKECRDGDATCCRWTFAQLCIDKIERYWSEKQIQARCIP